MAEIIFYVAKIILQFKLSWFHENGFFFRVHSSNEHCLSVHRQLRVPFSGNTRYQKINNFEYTMEIRPMAKGQAQRHILNFIFFLLNYLRLFTENKVLQIDTSIVIWIYVTFNSNNQKRYKYREHLTIATEASDENQFLFYI